MKTFVKHSGIHGMKWHKRRWQYQDGTFTPEGRIRYADSIRKHEEFLARKNGFKAFEDMRDEYGDVSVNDIPKRKLSFIEKILRDLSSDDNYYQPDDVMIHCAMIGNKFLEEYLSSDDILSHHGIPGQKWGVRRYQNYNGSLTPAGRERYGESKQLASQLFEKAKDHEPRITKDVMDSVNGTSAKMYGLEHKLKTEESLTRKIRTDSEEKKITPFDAAYGIKDGVRYTAVSPDNDFTSNYYKIKDSLEKKGYSEVRCKNYFDLYRQGQVKHKSVQSVFQSDDGYLFEMQFQTKASQDAKDKKVPIYEERRKPGLSKERQEALERQMVELAENVPDPKDVYKIKTHSSI